MSLEFHPIAHMPTLPAGAGDPNFLAKQTLTVTIGGTAQPSFDVPLDQVEVDLGAVPVGTVVEVSLVYADASGNASPARIASLTVADVVPPPQPGEFALSVKEVETTSPPAAE